MIIGYVIGIPVLELFYRTELKEYKLQFIMILLAYVVYAMGYVKTTILTLFRKMKEQFAIYGIVCITIGITSYLFVKKYEVYGASISYIMTMIVYYILCYIVTKLNYKKKRNSISQ
ncbi:MAG: hypothetical protein HFJ27_00870 [Clostridia bacterium]|nr:hypothetical protein [Clostridia bacterium]